MEMGYSEERKDRCEEYYTTKLLKCKSREVAWRRA
jgi:hypothetical protein